jgi:RND superfamily putative drug exporter
LLLAPALIVVLGNRIEAFDIRKPLRRLVGRPAGGAPTPAESFFYRIATASMKRAMPVTLIMAALFTLLAVPFLSVRVAYPDDRLLPKSAPTRQAGDLLRDGFPQNVAGAVRIVLPAGITSSSAVDEYARNLSRLTDLTGVAAPAGTYVAGIRISTDHYGAAAAAGAAYLTAYTKLDPLSKSAQELLGALKQVPAPAAALFSGVTQQNADNVHGISGKLPLAILLIAVTTFILIFLLTGSVLLPVKALLMSALSLTAAFGAMVWIFQDGHLAGFGTTTVGHINAAFPPLIFCIAFGLSMDYEVFVLSRIREEWIKSDRTTVENERAVALGLARTGRIVTAAATLMAVVFLAICASQVSSMRMLGVALTITVLIDAFLIRTILVPAAMRLMGRANWWAPAPLARWQTRWGLPEGADIEDTPVLRQGVPG